MADLKLYQMSDLHWIQVGHRWKALQCKLNAAYFHFFIFRQKTHTISAIFVKISSNIFKKSFNLPSENLFYTNHQIWIWQKDIRRFDKQMFKVNRFEKRLLKIASCFSTRPRNEKWRYARISTSWVLPSDINLYSRWIWPLRLY